MSVYHAQVGLVTNTDEILIWDIQGKVREIETSMAGLAPFGILFHPVNKDHFFVFYEGDYSIHVQEHFPHGKEVAHRYDHPNEFPESDGKQIW